VDQLDQRDHKVILDLKVYKDLMDQWERWDQKVLRVQKEQWEKEDLQECQVNQDQKVQEELMVPKEKLEIREI